MLQAWRGVYNNKGISKGAVDIIAASWKGSTRTQYQVYVRKWQRFCTERHINSMQTKIGEVLDFFTNMFKNGASYSTINSARSALSAFLIIDDGSHTLGSHPVVHRFMRGIFNMRPPAPRYSSTWDVKTVLDYLRKLSPARTLGLPALTQKLTMLIALVSAQRVQSIQDISLDRMKMKKSSVELCFSNTLKQCKPGNTGFNVNLQAYPPDRRLCVVTYMKEYANRTDSKRGMERNLLITYKKPYHRATTQTISRWIKTVMSSAGIDTQIFKPHSTRAASTSAAQRGEVPVSRILARAGWASEDTFRRFYCKPLMDSGQFANELLRQSSSTAQHIPK